MPKRVSPAVGTKAARKAMTVADGQYRRARKKANAATKAARTAELKSVRKRLVYYKLSGK